MPPPKVLVTKEDQEIVRFFMPRMTDREKEILRLRYRLDEPASPNEPRFCRGPSEISALTGMSPKNISGALKNATAKAEGKRRAMSDREHVAQKNQDQRDRMLGSLHLLSRREREFAEMYWRDEMTIEQIAQHLGLAPSGVGRSLKTAATRVENGEPSYTRTEFLGHELTYARVMLPYLKDWEQVVTVLRLGLDGGPMRDRYQIARVVRKRPTSIDRWLRTARERAVGVLPRLGQSADTELVFVSNRHPFSKIVKKGVRESLTKMHPLEATAIRMFFGINGSPNPKLSSQVAREMSDVSDDPIELLRIGGKRMRLELPDYDPTRAKFQHPGLKLGEPIQLPSDSFVCTT